MKIIPIKTMFWCDYLIINSVKSLIDYYPHLNLQSRNIYISSIKKYLYFFKQEIADEILSNKLG